VDYFRQ